MSHCPSDNVLQTTVHTSVRDSMERNISVELRGGLPYLDGTTTHGSSSKQRIRLGRSRSSDGDPTIENDNKKVPREETEDRERATDEFRVRSSPFPGGVPNGCD